MCRVSISHKIIMYPSPVQLIHLSLVMGFVATVSSQYVTKWPNEVTDMSHLNDRIEVPPIHLWNLMLKARALVITRIFFCPNIKAIRVVTPSVEKIASYVKRTVDMKSLPSSDLFINQWEFSTYFSAYSGVSSTLHSTQIFFVVLYVLVAWLFAVKLRTLFSAWPVRWRRRPHFLCRCEFSSLHSRRLTLSKVLIYRNNRVAANAFLLLSPTGEMHIWAFFICKHCRWRELNFKLQSF